MAVVMMVVPVMTMVEVPAMVTMMAPPMRVGVEHLHAVGRGPDHWPIRAPVR
jgi:hypothetical protein